MVTKKIYQNLTQKSSQLKRYRVKRITRVLHVESDKKIDLAGRPGLDTDHGQVIDVHC